MVIANTIDYLSDIINLKSERKFYYGDRSKMNFIQIEHDVLSFWEEHHCFEPLREKNKQGQLFRFLDGPITANNPMGIHHAILYAW